MNSVRTGIIAAAGCGSRMWPSSKVFPKELFPVGKLPAIAHVILEMVEAGIHHIAIVVRKDSFRAIEALLDPRVPPPANVQNEELVRRFERMIRASTFSFVEQSGPYGNGTPLLEAITFAKDEPCIYAFADDVVFGENVTAGLIKTYLNTGEPVLAAQAVPTQDISRFGILECVTSGAVDYVRRFIEKPSTTDTTSRLASLGRYLITENVVRALKNTPPGRNGEIWLSDAFVRLLDGGSLITAFRLTRGSWFTVGNPEGFARAVLAGLQAELGGLEPAGGGSESIHSFA
jgi:UTP--glucose-1-phosphate uridylyltransferase